MRWTVDELRFSVLLPAAVGLILLVGGILGGGFLPSEGLITGSRLVMAGGVAVILGMGIYLVSWGLARIGIGPLSRRMTSDPTAPVPAPPPDGWLLPGARWGIPWLFALACLSVIPVVVYVIAYLPWANLGNQIIPGFPAGNHGQTLWDLTKSMYDYHNNLRATHAASSPWWAWPLDLKPVWFYQDGFANDTTGSIHDGGNLVIFWMGIAAMAFCAWAAWVRRSLPITLIVLMWAAMWLPWARIDRATFQYHVYASLPFIVMALGYLLAELWHGPSRVAWAVARGAAAFAILSAADVAAATAALLDRGRGEGRRGQPGVRGHRVAAAAGEPPGPRGRAHRGRGPEACSGSCGAPARFPRTNAGPHAVPLLHHYRAVGAGADGRGRIITMRLLSPTRCPSSRSAPRRCPGAGILLATPLRWRPCARPPTVRGRRGPMAILFFVAWVPEHLRAAAAVRLREHLPGPAADLDPRSSSR
ncbi:MAG: hypothetical protein U0869_02465 [Chloroflexota bacterium]